MNRMKTFLVNLMPSDDSDIADEMASPPSTMMTLRSDLGITVTDNPDPVIAGDEIEYVIAATHNRSGTCAIRYLS